MDWEANRLAALPPPSLPAGITATPSRAALQQMQPPDAVMDALHGWLSSAAMERLLRLRTRELHAFLSAYACNKSEIHLDVSCAARLVAPASLKDCLSSLHAVKT